MDYAIILGFGALGGLIRSAVGVKKSMDEAKIANKPFAFDSKYFATTTIIAAIAGAISTFVLGTSESTPSALIPIGYAGIDLVEGLWSKYINPK